MLKANLKKKKSHSIQVHILLYFSILIVATVIVIGGTFYYKSSRTIEKTADEYTYQIVDQVGRNIEYYIGYMEDVSSIIYYSPIISSYLLNSSVGSQFKEAEKQQIIGLLDSVMKMRNDIVSIYIFGKDGQVLTSDKFSKLKEYVDVTELSWYKEAVAENGSPVVSSSHVQNFVKGRHNWVVSLSRQINTLQSNKPLGVLLIDLNYKAITDICSKINLGQKGYVFILDEMGNIVYHPQQQLIYTKLKNENIEKILTTTQRSIMDMENGKKRMITIKTLPNIGWKIVGVSYLDDLSLSKDDIRNSYIIMTIIGLFIATLISAQIASNISRPIKKLESLMRRVEAGDFDVNIDIKSNDEIEHLGISFKIMLQRIKELMEQAKNDQTAIRRSELKALQAQINPHFLYNALDAIVWMAESKKHDKVVLMTSALAKFFRISLSKGKEVILVKDEIEHIKNYLVIQKIRYDKKLDYSIHVNEDILNYDILKLVLQPLVENSIYHGIKNLSEKGNVEITGSKVDDKILLQVKDNGVGIPEERFKNILFNESENKMRTGGVGLKNVHERIQLYYGDAYGLTIESKVNEGTTVNVWLPVST